MNSNKFEDLTQQILSDNNRQNLQNMQEYDRNLIDRNLLHEHQKFLSFDRHNVKLKQPNCLESTDQIDLRVKKGNDLRDRLKKFTKNMRKQLQPANEYCGMHQRVEPIEVSMLQNKLNEKVLPVPDIDSVLRGDEAMFEQHQSNIDKANKLLDVVRGYNYVEGALPAVHVVNESTAFLRETVNDVDYLNECGTMYAGLTKQASNSLYAKELKELSNHFE